MTAWSHDGLRAPPPEAEDRRGFATLQMSLSAVSAGSHQSKSPQGLNQAPKQERGVRGQDGVKPVKDPQLFVDIPKIPHAAEAALSALQYLPTPILVLSSFKTIILANEAMGRLLGLDSLGEDNVQEDESRTPSRAREDLLRGQSLSQIGIDVIEDGQSIWVSWEVSFY